jgi:orotate phosphoribosyltransferase
MQPDLLKMLSAREGHFKLESGHHNNFWLDLDLLFLRPRAVHRFAVELANRLAKHKPDAICGPLVGGALIAEMIAAELDVEFCYTERFVPAQRDAMYSMEYRLPAGLRGPLHGKAVAIVDDVISAGSAVRGTLAELQTYGARPVAIGALLVLGNLAANFFAERNLPLEYIAGQPSSLWLPSECPLCAAQVPLEDMVASQLSPGDAVNT